MTPVRAPYRGNAWGVAGNGQPVVHRCPDAPSFERRLSLALVARDEKQNPVAGSDRPFQRTVDRFPCPVQTMSVEVDNPVRLHAT